MSRKFVIATILLFAFFGCTEKPSQRAVQLCEEARGIIIEEALALDSTLPMGSIEKWMEKCPDNVDRIPDIRIETLLKLYHYDEALAYVQEIDDKFFNRPYRTREMEQTFIKALQYYHNNDTLAADSCYWRLVRTLRPQLDKDPCNIDLFYHYVITMSVRRSIDELKSELDSNMFFEECRWDLDEMMPTGKKSGFIDGKTLCRLGK